jgi:DNA-binding CsgD family transcriptional regulator/tetratricopeptide (TPR) repeat protein
MCDADVMAGQSGKARFIGRSEELAAIDRLLAALPGQAASVLLVTGEAGMGKSRLAAELRERAEAAGFLVAIGRTPADGETLPYGTVVGLFGDLARKLAPAPRSEFLEPVQRLLLGSPDSQQQHGPLTRIQLLDAARCAFEGLAAESPVVLVLEDLHWSDNGSIELLDYLARNIDDHPVLLAATYRPDEIDRRPALRRVLTELRRLPSVTTVDLAGLSRDEIAALLADTTGEQQPWPVVDAIHRRSEGNPLFAEELVLVRETGGLPPALRDLLAQRVGQLVPDARVVAAAVSVLNGVADHRALAPMTDLVGEALDRAIAGARGGGVLVVDRATGSVRFRHALLGEATDAELLPGERARLHRRAAEAIASDPTLVPGGPAHAAAALGEHWFEAGEWAAACSASIEAANASMRLYEIHSAYAHMCRVLDAHRLASGTCTHAGVDEAELYRSAAEWAGLLGELDAALGYATTFVELVEPADTERAVEAWLLLTTAAWNVGDAEQAFAAIAAAESQVDHETGGRAAAEVANTHARLLMLNGRAAESVACCDEALPLARAAGARVTEGHLLATLGPCRATLGDNDGALAAMEEALVVGREVDDPALLLRAFSNLTHVLYQSGRIEAAARVGLDAMRDDNPLAPIQLGGAGHNAIEAMVVLGWWDDAADLAVAMEGRAMATCSVDPIIPALIALRRGDPDGAEHQLGPHLPTSPQAVVQRHVVEAEIALARDREDEAAECIDRALDVLAGTDFALDSLVAYALGLQALGDRVNRPARSSRRPAVDTAKAIRVAESMIAEVDRLIDDESARGVESSPIATAFASLCRAEATRVGDTRPDAWATAAQVWDELPGPYHAAYCRYREAEARLSARGDRRAATEALLEAWRVSRRLGAGALVARCERLAKRARIELDDPQADDATPMTRAAASLGLTTREVEVLALLARGRTDAQIAAELFVSKKTASVHVSNIVRKLDARDRWHAGEVGRDAGLGAEP